MYYVFLQYNKGYGEKDFRGFKTEWDLIAFLLKNGKGLLIHKIFKVSKEYKLGLIELAEKTEKKKRGRPPSKPKLHPRCEECGDLVSCKKRQYIVPGKPSEFKCEKYKEEDFDKTE